MGSPGETECVLAGGSFDELEFLSSAAQRLTELGPDEDIFECLAERLANLAPQTAVFTSEYDATAGCTVVRAMAGPTDLLQSLQSASPGGALLGARFPVSDEARAAMADGKIVRLEGLAELVFHTLPPETCRALERRTGVRSVHAQPFSREGDFLGTAAFLSRGPALPHLRLIEACVRLAAVAIQRRRVEARLRESESRFRMLAENARDVLFRARTRPDFVVEYVCPAAKDITGYAPEEFYADATMPLRRTHPDDVRRAKRAFHGTPVEPALIRWQRRDGEYTWLECNLVPIRDEHGEMVAFEGSARDVTARKEAEAALREAGRRKDEFLAMLSHELRNPLTPIRNSVYLLARAPPDSEKARRAREVIERQVRHLTRLVDDLLDVTRISRGKVRLQLERVDLAALVRGVVEDHRSVFERAGVSLELEPGPADVWVRGDRTRLTQIVGNLLQNAARFTPRGGRTTLSLEEARREAVLTVRDTGMGVAPELLPHLFEPFVQADRTLARSQGGLGLGLALAKGLAELQHGSIAVSSAGPGRGAAFTVRLPLEEAAPEELPAVARLPRGPSRVLLVEDNLDAAESLREVLALDGYTVVVADSGPAGLDLALSFRPDVIVCDIGLPGMDGYAVARAVRARPELRDTYLVALSGYAGPDDVAQAHDAGFDAHVAKPPSIDTLERILSSAGALPVRSAAGEQASPAP